ncbi:unnamed protein product [Penicillium egyptiacum]|uniref:Beta-galactosidase n=1 Tax=Penicillium egyptiacum TaxID=1303716 RepID=A0A9W4P5M8_9EURO|nr:unnamed protein product [Penicillium egyptiacum]
MKIILICLFHLLALLTLPTVSDKSTQPRLSLQSPSEDVESLVTWDEYSIFIRGERVLFLSGEFHPFRLPSPGLWLDIFQKIRALGYSGVSFYLMWGLQESEPGRFQTRPGPYINAEVSGGGLPGWLQRLKGDVRSVAPDFLNATRDYVTNVGRIISEAQITNGGPVVLFQPENEYTMCSGFTSVEEISTCLDKDYMAHVEDLYRESGLVVPFVSNDAVPLGNWAPGTGPGAMDLYGFDNYPFGWGTGCQDPSNWTRILDPLSLYNFTTNRMMSPETPFSIIEYQGGAPDPWGGQGINACAAMINHEFARIFYKLNFGFRATIVNLYMMFDGTNWGNLGYPSGYTSYDVGAAITEDRLVAREKYSEIKLQAQFMQAFPAYLTSQPLGASFANTNTSSLVTTLLRGVSTNFYVVRHFDYGSLESTRYTVDVDTSVGRLTIPTLGGSLTINGRDSKIHVTDYDVGGINLVYSSAEIYTWKKTASKNVLLMYGEEGERHEFAIALALEHPSIVEGDEISHQRNKSATIVQWSVRACRQIIRFGNALEVYLLQRNDAYNYWVLDLPHPPPLGLHMSPSRSNFSVIVKGGYLMRNATIYGDTLALNGDLNGTVEVEVIATPAGCCSALIFNGKHVKTTVNGARLRGVLEYESPMIRNPDLNVMDWHYIDSLPELGLAYNDSRWTQCDRKTSNNPRSLTTPTSLYASDYGYHAGSVLYRGYFVANGDESLLRLSTQGGFAYAHSVWLNSTFLGSWAGSAIIQAKNQTLGFPGKLMRGAPYVITVLVDHMGLDANFYVNEQTMKAPRGLLDYSLSGHQSKSDVTWKITGNFNGEKTVELSRGPLNEGSTFAERQGYHLPGAPFETWQRMAPQDGLSQPGVGLFATTFKLDYPYGYDIPTSIVFTNTSAVDDPRARGLFRIQLFVNGWQFGKYSMFRQFSVPQKHVSLPATYNLAVNNIGPQTAYPIPEGIVNHHGENYLALTLWALDDRGAKLDGIRLENTAIIQTGYAGPDFVDAQSYAVRYGSY